MRNKTGQNASTAPTRRRRRQVSLTTDDWLIQETVGLGVGVDGGNNVHICEELKQAGIQDQHDAQLMLDKMRKR
jgi:hypothetical protein